MFLLLVCNTQNSPLNLHDSQLELVGYTDPSTSTLYFTMRTYLRENYTITLKYSLMGKAAPASYWEFEKSGAVVGFYQREFINGSLNTSSNGCVQEESISSVSFD